MVTRAQEMGAPTQSCSLRVCVVGTKATEELPADLKMAVSPVGPHGARKKNRVALVLKKPGKFRINSKHRNDFHT